MQAYNRAQKQWVDDIASYLFRLDSFYELGEEGREEQKKEYMAILKDNGVCVCVYVYVIM